ncbi:hypothetical protein NI17_009035 [Thermobifida halotolerans]|uniref:Uncharacterized protein n=1 Tax=Thermobifida halotolerans TaxID=483545 RepID=A0AA97M0C0_9ACTN|nr:hypothetical protein [Thermobifida halotolerans]UOE21261.1 hypothetical protein NI17_009035 [Thermobifida halotolerans]
MRIDIAWWDLDASAQTIDTLRGHLADAAAVWGDVPGLRLKLWMADRDRNRWGAVMVWEESRPHDSALPPNRAAELIGYPPTHRSRFEVEAAVEGLHALPTLHGLGPALTPADPPPHTESSPCTST